MSTTTFLAQMWGPTLLAVGIGIFLSRDYYIKIYRDLEKETLAVLIFGMMAMAAGIAHIHFHNTWASLPEIVISFLGWGLLLKGILFATTPQLVDRMGDKWASNSALLALAGGLTLIVGVYLSWLGFFM